jgi:ferric-dicitrate binding protein FerR (iron transport regulator)
MDKRILHAFFAGKATPDEREAVRQWLNEPDGRREELLKEREFFDMLLLADVRRKHAAGRQKIARAYVREALKIAAVIVLLLLAGTYVYNRRMGEIRQAMYTVTVEEGQRASLRLPDGTEVWLNARSRISCPAYFTGATREVELDGEAYFTVKHDARKPFVVHTDRYDVRVRGTAFNVDSYAGSGTFSTALLEGSVEILNREYPVQSVQLQPARQAKEVDGRLVTCPIEDYDIYRWREGLLCFRETTFPALMSLFEKFYGVRIVIENEKPGGKVFSGKFRISDGVDNALRVLQKDARFTFDRENDGSVIYIR